MTTYDTVIIGGGPAGLSAGLYAARAGLQAILLEKSFLGGQAVTTSRVPRTGARGESALSNPVTRIRSRFFALILVPHRQE